MKPFITVVLTYFLSTCIAGAQQSLPADVVFKIKQEALENSKIESLAVYLTDYAGPRLPASKQGERGEELAKNKLEELGFSNARIERAADFSRGGWDNTKTYAAMTVPYYCNFSCTPKAWSGSTHGVVSGEVILLKIDDPKDIEKYKGKLCDKIVLMPATMGYSTQFTPYATRQSDERLAELAKDPRFQSSSTRTQNVVRASTGDIIDLQQMISTLLEEEKPAVIVSGDGVFNVPRSLSVPYRYGDPEPVAELVLPVEAHGRMTRMIDANINVSMEIEIKNEFYDNQVMNNVMAELPGTDPKLKNEIVMIGGHLDSWHGGTGATDNAAGCVVMMEALRIIKAIGAKPRRTIRIALWGGEEQAMVGSIGYRENELFDVDNNKPRKGYDQFALYLNMDHGSGKFRGIYLEENDMAFPFFREWSKGMEAMDFGVLSPRKTGWTDHATFDEIGLPSFQFIQDDLEYRRSYHTLMDTYERLVISDLQYNAIVIACLALSAAMDDGKIPPKPF